MNIDEHATWYGLGGASTNAKLGDWELNLQGDVDFDDTVFGHLNDGTWTADQAQWAWQYTDGY